MKKKEIDKKLLTHQVNWLVSVCKYLSLETSTFLEFFKLYYQLNFKPYHLFYDLK